MLRARGLVVGHPGASPSPPLDLHIRAGDWIAVSGPNGGGKSALLLTLGGLLEPRAGELHWAGTVGGDGVSSSRIGVALQDAEAQLLTDTARHELALPLENLGWTRQRIDRRVQALIQEFELEGLADRPLERLSGGEQARVAVASALAHDPPLLLLDEPGASLDARGRDLLLSGLEERVAAGGALVVATQLPEEWQRARRRLWLDADGLREVGPPSGDAAAAVRQWLAGDGASSGDAPQALAQLTPRRPPGDSRQAILLLRARDVWFCHARLAVGEWTLRGASLALHRGETVLLLGPSGCGKTTLLHLLAGLLEPTHGIVEAGEALRALPPARRLGVLLQSPEDQLVGETVFADLLLGSSRPAARERVRAAEALAAVQLDATFLDRPPDACSVGERRRIAWAGLRLLEAAVWFLDEPTAGLDEAGVLALLASIKQFNKRGGAAILATQDARVSAQLRRELALAGPSSVQLTQPKTSPGSLPAGQKSLDLDRT